MPRVVVVGAGIAGLAAAVELRSRGIDVLVLEATERAGGPINTVRKGGFIIDGGPDSFLSTKPAGLQFAARLGLEDRVINTSPDGGGTFIVHNGRPVPLPEGISMLVPTQFRQILESDLLDPGGKARLLADYFIPARPGDEDESVASFMRRRVGSQAFERLAEPLLSGIFAGDAERLSIQSTFPRLREAERQHGGLIRAALAARRAVPPNGAKPRHTPFVSFRAGLGTIVDAAINEIGQKAVSFECPVEAIIPSSNGYTLHTRADQCVEADGVLLTTPAGETARLLNDIAPDAARTLSSMTYVSSATVSLAFRERDIDALSTGRGFVVPRAEGIDLTAVTWSSRKFAGRAPDGRLLMRGFVGRSGNEGPAFQADEDIVETVRDDLAAITGISAEPLFSKVFRWYDAMPQYHVGHEQLVRRVEKSVAAISGLAVAGAAYRGVGIPDCISYATRSAAALAESLGT